VVQAQRNLRIVQFIFLAYAVFLFWLMHIIKPQEPPGGLTVVHKAIAVFAVIDCVIGMVLRRMIMTGSLGRSGNPAAASPVKRWFSANVIGLAFALSTCLFGFVLHMLSAPGRLPQALVALGILVMLFLSPGAPPAEQPGSSSYPSIE
jgi:hypothetical protein